MPVTRTSRSLWRAGLPLVCASALALLPVTAAAQMSPTRLPDKDVKNLIKQVDDNRDKFVGSLDSSLKNSKLRGPRGEVDISAYLKDYEDNIDKLKERFTDDYAASTETHTVLQQANQIDTFMHNQPAGTKGRSEWDREAASLKSLAAVYGTTFPMPEGANVRRMNDKEVAQAADGLATAADHLKSSLGKNSGVPKAELDPAKKDADALKKAADTLKSRLNGGKPASDEFRILSTNYSRVESFVGSHQVPASSADWTDIQNSMTKLRQAFGM
jgi:hypothetical protein